MHTLTKGSFKNLTLEDDKATSLEMKVLEQEKQERNTAEKKTSRVNAAQGSVRALLALVITMCLRGNPPGLRMERIEDLEKFEIKGKVIYHQTMTPSWLVAHASYINSYRLNATEQLTFTAGPSQHDISLLKVPVIPAGALRNSSALTVKIVVCNDIEIGEKEESDPRYGMSDGISFVGFETVDKNTYAKNFAPCFGIEGSSGSTLTGQRWIGYSSPRPVDTSYPGQFVITLKLDAHENWGFCYTAHDGGFVNTAGFNNRLVLSNGLSLEAYKHEKFERVGIKFLEVTVVEDV
ncbi:hypothetical protein ACROYT_G042083 [Oculina patagonica]